LRPIRRAIGSQNRRAKGERQQGDVSAFDLLIGGDPALYAITALSLIVSASATLLAVALCLPLGALLARFCFSMNRPRTLTPPLLKRSRM
jgi:ABC-type tungstate transport system substrate-binding protein